MTSFRPHAWTVGGHRQTLLGHALRSRLRWTVPAEDLVVEGAEDVRLLVRASWQPGERRGRPALLLVHGLEGCDTGSYVVATGLHAWSRGWHVLRMNMRGCGDSARLCARLYNAGLAEDLLAVVSHVAPLTPRLAVAGFSLGANLVLLAAGRHPERVPAEVTALAAVSPPLDLQACADALCAPRNRLYHGSFLRRLVKSYRQRQRRRPDLYTPGRERGIASLIAYDDAITAHYGGYRDAAEYYARSSAGPHLIQIDRPALILAAQDDPLIPAASVSRWLLPASGRVVREMLPTGGHVGFVAPTRAPGRFWAAERVLDFLEGNGA